MQFSFRARRERRSQVETRPELLENELVQLWRHLRGRCVSKRFVRVNYMYRPTFLVDLQSAQSYLLAATMLTG